MIGAPGLRIPKKVNTAPSLPPIRPRGLYRLDRHIQAERRSQCGCMGPMAARLNYVEAIIPMYREIR
jgi:hypothetical protein